jgi:MFS family permease
MRSSNGAFGSRARVDLAPVVTLLVSASLLVLGNGLQGTLLLVRAGNEGFRGEVIGIMMSAYFAGYALGAILLPPVVASAGHIRAFAGFASIASAVTIAHVLLLEPWVWVVLRAVTGLVYAGMVLVTESWLNAHAVSSSRGRLLSLYGIVTMGAWALGQGLLNLSSPDDVVLFLVASILISLALVPITLLPSQPPMVPRQAPLALRQLFQLSPLGMLGALLSGLALSAFWAMGPGFAQGVGLGTAGVSAFMAAALLGALLLQWPLGWLADRRARRTIIAVAAFAAALAGSGLALAKDAELPVLLLLSFLFGGFGIPLYTLCLAHANDRLSTEEMLAAARSLLLLNGVGAALGAFAAGVAMSWFGPEGPFAQAAALLVLLALIAVLRQFEGPAEAPIPPPLPGTPQITMTLDTRAGDAEDAVASSHVPGREENAEATSDLPNLPGTDVVR